MTSLEGMALSSVQALEFAPSDAADEMQEDLDQAFTREDIFEELGILYSEIGEGRSVSNQNRFNGLISRFGAFECCRP